MTNREQELWQQMLERSFAPADWYVTHDDVEEPSMWLYRQVGKTWNVGRLDKRGEWHPHRSFPTILEAASFAFRLNADSQDKG